MGMDMKEMQEQQKSAGLSRGIGVVPIWRANVAEVSASS